MGVVLALQQDAQSPFQGIDIGEATIGVYFIVTPAGNYAAGGDALDFTKLGDLLKSTRPPLQVYIQSQPAAGASGYLYSYRPGAVASISNGKMQVFQSAGAGNPHSELGAGAYPAGVLADVIVGFAIFPRM